jgi:hypothetical protein
LWGDGEHDDTAALNAWFRGETVVWAQTHEKVGAEIADRTFLLSSMVYMAEPLDQRVQLVTSKAQVRAIDEWRRRQPDLPSRSEAIRRLINAALNAVSNGPKRERSTKS